MNPTTSTRSYFPALDGLRGIAILLVICCHNFDFLPYFEFGRVGVDLFFVLSGFLITDILLKTREKKNFLRNFYLRRVLKIFPVYYGALLLFFIIAPIFQNAQVQYNYYQSNQPFLWLHLQNWLQYIHIQPEDSMVLSHFWSLSVEAQFYLIWPLMVLVVTNTRLLSQILILVVVICVLARFSSWSYFGAGSANFYFQHITRLDGICIGSLIAIWRLSSYDQTKKRVLQLGLITLILQIILFAVSKTLVTFPHFAFTGYTFIAASFGTIVFFAAEKRNFLSKIVLENAVIRFIGRISYGLFVFHWPILAMFKIYLLKNLADSGFSYQSGYLAISLLALATTVFISLISYYFFEKKILALKDVMTQDDFFARVWKKLLLFFYQSSARKPGSQ